MRIYEKTMKPGYLWTVYSPPPSRVPAQHPIAPMPPGRNRIANPSKLFRELLFASVRTWRHWHPEAYGAICDHDRSLSPADRKTLFRPPYQVITYEPDHTTNPPTTVNKLYSLADSPWEQTVHADHDVIWTADSGPSWDEVPDIDCVSLGRHWRPPVGYLSPGAHVALSPLQDGLPKLWPCANLFLCRNRRAAQAALAHHDPRDSDEAALARVEGLRLITCATLPLPPRYFCQFVGNRDGWKLTYHAEKLLCNRWLLTNADGFRVIPVALHLGGRAGKLRFLHDPDVRHYLSEFSDPAS